MSEAERLNDEELTGLLDELTDMFGEGDSFRQDVEALIAEVRAYRAKVVPVLDRIIVRSEKHWPAYSKQFCVDEHWANAKEARELLALLADPLKELKG